MKTIILSDGKLEVKEIENSLENLQKIVGGYIEIPLLSKVFRQHNIDTIINDEGKYIEGLRPQIALVDGRNNQVLDVVYGNCIFASHDEYGETIGLNEEQIRVVMEELKQDTVMTYKDSEKEFIVKVLFV